MARRPDTNPGIFNGNPTPPQRLGLGARMGLGLGALTPAGAARSRPSMNSNVYTGTGESPQQFVRQAGGTSSELPVRPPLSQRRAVGKTRGLPNQIAD